MNRKILIFIVAAVVAAGSVWFLYLRPTTTVVSDDGRLKLRIAEGSLPDGVSVGDISIRRVVDDEVSPEIAVYEFLPDGLQFSKPARLWLPSEKSEDGGFYVPYFAEFNLDGTLGQAAPNADMTINAEDGTAVATVEMTHFSTWALLSRGQLWIWAQTPESPSIVGEHVFIDGRIWESYAKIETKATGFKEDIYRLGGELVAITYTDITGTSEAIDGAPYLSPQGVVRNKPKATRVEENTKIPVDASGFDCAKKGRATIEWNIAYESHSRRGGKYTGNVRAHIPVQCIEESEAGPAYELVDPTYFVHCPGFPPMTGIAKSDKNKKPVFDAQGNYIDRDTGKSVVCPKR